MQYSSIYTFSLMLILCHFISIVIALWISKTKSWKQYRYSSWCLLAYLKHLKNEMNVLMRILVTRRKVCIRFQSSLSIFLGAFKKDNLYYNIKPNLKQSNSLFIKIIIIERNKNKKWVNHFLIFLCFFEDFPFIWN